MLDVKRTAKKSGKESIGALVFAAICAAILVVKPEWGGIAAPAAGIIIAAINFGFKWLRDWAKHRD
jgi:hypothetical protein